MTEMVALCCLPWLIPAVSKEEAIGILPHDTAVGVVNQLLLHQKVWSIDPSLRITF